MVKEFLNYEVNTAKTFLSSESKIYKTERFFFQTKKLAGVNGFILKIAETLLSKLFDIKQNFKTELSNKLLKIQTIDGQFCFYAVVGSAVKNNYLVEKDDIIFVRAEKLSGLKQNDQRINFYLKASRLFSVVVSLEEKDINEDDFKKIYLISGSEYVNFPLLSQEQAKLVEIENQNVLIQGVAGSGKTNICYSKLIWTACRNYSGKVLYTTFSRGLLIDTKTKLDLYKSAVKRLIEDYKQGRIVFLDKNHKKAIENRLGIYIVADTEQNILKKLIQISEFIENNIEYKLLSDLYKDYFSDEINEANESVFINEFLQNLNNHQLKSRLDRIKNISPAVIYKEIYGMIFGGYCGEDLKVLSLNDYILKRKNSFEKYECEIIYDLAMAYEKFQRENGYVDNNKISREILLNSQKLNKYSLVVADEVQDFTEINLWLFNKLTLKMFAVGDALQMINPSYFSFAFLKKLLYKEDVTNVIELECNYRNNKKIVEILDALSKINIREFGTHSFVISATSVDNSEKTNAVYCMGEDFLNSLAKDKFEDYTFLVADDVQKQKLRQLCKKQEILTISEIKGLERETVVLVNVLSSNEDKWRALNETEISHKTADENSVYRYYFNLFYVGLSRAKHNLFVVEQKEIPLFNEFFNKNFETLNSKEAFNRFAEVVSRQEIDEDEIYERINEFIRLGQFDNAKFYAIKLGGYEEIQQLEKIEAYKNFVFRGKNKEAGIKLWKAGLTAEAKQQFAISGDTKLIEFLDNLESNNQSNLDGEIVKFWNDFADNEDAKSLIVDTLKQELEQLKLLSADDKFRLSKFKEKKYGNKRSWIAHWGVCWI